MELRIVAEMLQQPPGDRGRFAIGVVGQRFHVFRPHPHAAIDDGQPIGHGRPRHEVGIGEERQGVGKVVHLGFPGPTPLERIIHAGWVEVASRWRVIANGNY